MTDGKTNPSRVLEAADRLLSGEMLAADARTVHRARFLAMVVSATVVVSLGFLVWHVQRAELLRTVFVGASIVPVLLTFWILRRTKWLGVATHYLLTVLLGMIVLSPVLSADAPKIFLGVIVIPLVAVAAGGIRVGLSWTVVVGVVLAMSAIGFDMPDAERLVAWNSVIVAIGVGIAAVFFEESRQRAKRKVDQIARHVDQQSTQRVEAEAALASSQAILASAFEFTPAVLILSELATGQIVRINESFSRVSGWSEAEVLGKTLTELNAWIAPEDRDRLFELVVDKEPTSTVELRLRGQGGRQIWLLASAAIVELDGAAHVLAQGVDITERKRDEEQLERYRRLLEDRVEERSEQLRESRVMLQEQQRLAAIGTLTAGIAHQINNPIGGIMAAAELALMSDDAPDREMLRTRALETTLEESRRCAQIIRNMLKFSRHEPTAKWVEDLNDIVRRAAELTRSYVVERGGSLDIDILPGPLLAQVSPIDIEQVLVNVIRNAAESRVGGARVAVSTRRNGSSEMTIEVSDDGAGIAEKDRDHVFDPFFTTRLDIGGSGLGLSVAHGVVEDHGGVLDLDSRPEKGTRVVVRLPLYQDET